MSTSSKRVINPFPGLRPFETEEYRLFFGREGQSDELLARLERSRFLAVVGTSGSGKSSLIRAGLMPALRGGMMKGAGSGWRIAVMRPGGDPIGNLAAELVKKDVLVEAGAGLSEQEAEAVIEATLRSGSLGIVNVARQARLSEHEKLLVIVDQFEELFRFRATQESTSLDEASAFVKLLLEASQQREVAIYIVLTMRSDFLGDCAQFQGLPEAINDGQYLIPRMTRDERRFAVTGPVGVTRGKITEPLVNRLLNDVGDNPDQLPILQHALMRTWDHWQTNRRNGEPIGIEHYQAIGTMSDALSRHADEAFNQLPDQRSRQIAEILFKALSERGADNREIRRPTRLETICRIADANMAEVIAIIDVFRGGGRSFLMPPADKELHAGSVVDISHESLIRNWQRLKQWVDEEAQSARIYRRVAEAAVLHAEGTEGLIQDPALQFALDWREKTRPNAAWAERYHPEFETAIAYLDKSSAAREERIAAEEARRNEEIARDKRELEQTKLFVAQQARSARRMRWLVMALCLISLVAIGMTVAAVRSQRRAVVAYEAANRAQEESVRRFGIAVSAQQLAASEQKKAEDAATRANEQAALAASHLKDAVAAQQKARDEVIAKNKEIQIDSISRDALSFLRRGDFSEAEHAFRYLTKEFQHDPPRLAWALSNLGVARRELGELDKSIEDLSEARRIQSKDDKKYFDTITWLAESYSDKGQYEQAEPLFLEAYDIWPNPHIMEQVARTHNFLGELEEAEASYEKALVRRRANRSRADLIVTLKEVANFQLSNGDPKTAIKLYEEVLSTQTAMLPPDDINIAITFNRLSEAYEEVPLKRRAERLNALARQIRLSRQSQGGTDSVGQMIRLAHLYLEDGRFKAVEPLLLKANEIFIKASGAESQGTASHFTDLGNFYLHTAKLWPAGFEDEPYRQAQNWYDSAITLGRRKGFTNELVHALDGLAALRLAEKKYAESERLYKETLEIRERNPNIGLLPELMLIENLHGLAASAVELRKFEDAEAYYLRTQKVIDKMSQINVNMVLIARRLDVSLLHHLTSVRLGEVYRSLGRLKEAEEQYKPLAEKLKAISKESLRSELNAESYLEIVDAAGKFYAQQNNLAAAEFFYKLVWSEDVRPTVRVLVDWPEENYSKSIMALAPDSSVKRMIEILNSYAALLKRSGREREADLIDFGIQRLHSRLE